MNGPLDKAVGVQGFPLAGAEPDNLRNGFAVHKCKVADGLVWGTVGRLPKQPTPNTSAEGRQGNGVSSTRDAEKPAPAFHGWYRGISG